MLQLLRRKETVKAAAAPLKEEEKLVLSVALNGLLARLAVCDGPITEREKAAIDQRFVVTGWVLTQHVQMLTDAQNDSVPVARHAMRIREACGKARDRLDTLFDNMCAVAAADGSLSIPELSMLSDIGLQWGFTERHLIAKFREKLLSDPNLPEKPRARKIHFHPDRVTQGHPLVKKMFHECFVSIADDRKKLPKSR